MENVIKRFPNVAVKILNNLDTQNLVRCKVASKEIAKFFENDRFFWIKIIMLYKYYFKGQEESWKQVLKKCPIPIVKSNFFQKRYFHVEGFHYCNVKIHFFVFS